MTNARIWIFNVEHGFQLFMRSPSGATLAIDAGKASNFSPAKYVYDSQLNWFEQYCGITRFLLSHPHEDHIEDITGVANWLKPQQVYYQRYDWVQVKEKTGNIEDINRWRAFLDLRPYPVAEPYWGMGVSYWSLPLDVAQCVSTTYSQYLNNSSIVVVLQLGSFKMVVPGDLEAGGWETMLRYPGFRAAIAGTTILVASHHGHTSGYTPEIFKSAGLPHLIVISTHSKDESVEHGYGNWAMGAWQGFSLRKTLTTRTDGTLEFVVDESGNWWWRPEHLMPNLAPAPATALF